MESSNSHLFWARRRGGIVGLLQVQRAREREAVVKLLLFQRVGEKIHQLSTIKIVCENERKKNWESC